MNNDLMTSIGVNVPGGAGTVIPAMRDNPRRLHLLVSPILGKHIPCDPDLLAQATAGLAAHISALVGPGTPVTVLGFAETATSLGAHLAADLHRAGHDTWSLCSTRHVLDEHRPVLEFTEPHSHAAEHRLYASDLAALAHQRVLVLADDELSTGVTAANAIRALHQAHPRARYVLATLTDARRDDAPLRAVEFDLGVRVDVVARDHVDVTVSPDAPVTARRLGVLTHQYTPPSARTSKASRLAASSSASDPVLGVHMPDDTTTAQAVRQIVDALQGRGLDDMPVHVLGVEEDMFVAHRVAAAIPGAVVSSTTRSPAFVRQDEGYPLRSRTAYVVGDGTSRFAYNTPLPGTRVVVVHGPRYQDDIDALTRALIDTGVPVSVAPFTYSTPLEPQR